MGCACVNRKKTELRYWWEYINNVGLVRKKFKCGNTERKMIKQKSADRKFYE